MVRFLMWFLFWLFTLCSIDVKVRYTDGLCINFKGWMTPVINWFKQKADGGSDEHS